MVSSCYGMPPLCAVNKFHSHWLIQLLSWPVAKQERARWDIKGEIQGEEGQSGGRSQSATRAARCAGEQVMP